MSPQWSGEWQTETLKRTASIDSQGLHIIEDEAEGDELEAAIERVRGERRPVRSQAVPHRPGAPPQKPQRPLSARARLVSEPKAPPASPVAEAVAPEVTRPGSRGPPLSVPRTRPRPSSAGARIGVQTVKRPSGMSTVPGSSWVPSPPSMPRPVSAHSATSSQPAGRQRPQSADSHRRQRPLSAATEASTCRASIRQASPQRCAVLHSGQLISRHVTEREAKHKILSVLARQLERFRECIPAWGAQRRAVIRVVARKERELRERAEEVEREKEDIERLVSSNAKQYSDLAKALEAQEQDNIGRRSRTSAALERALQAENDAKRVLADEEERYRQLRETLDRTVKQLEQVKSDTQKAEALLAEPFSSEIASSYRQLEKATEEKQQVCSQHAAVLKELKQLERALVEQQSYSVHLEKFAKRVSAGGGRYVLDPALKRRASKLLIEGSKLHPHEFIKADMTLKADLQDEEV